MLTWFTIQLTQLVKNKIQSDLEIEMARMERSFSDKIDHTYSIIKNINYQISENPHSKKHINEILKRYCDNNDLTNLSWTIFSWSDDKYQFTVDAKYGIISNPANFSVENRDYIPLTKKEPNKFHIGTKFRINYFAFFNLSREATNSKNSRIKKNGRTGE